MRRQKGDYVSDKITCPHCGKETVPDVSFCMNCGQKIQQKRWNKNHGIQLSGFAGVLIIGIALINLVDVEVIDFPPIWIHVSGIVVAVGLGTGAVLLQLKKRLPAITTLLLLLTTETILLTTQYLFDVMNRSVYSRYMLTIIAVILVAFVLSTQYIYDNTLIVQQIHLLLGTYFGWMLLYTVAGSNYLSSTGYTILLATALLVSQYFSIKFSGGLQSPASMLFSGLVLINLQVYNFANIFAIALLAFIVPPLLLHYLHPKNFARATYSVLISVFAVLYAVASSTLPDPFSQIVLVVFAVAWAWFSKVNGTDNRVSEGMTTGVIIAVLIYSFNHSGWPVVFTFIGGIIVLALLFNQLKMMRLPLQLLAILTMFVVILMNYPEQFNLLQISVFAVVSTCIIFANEIGSRKISNEQLSLIQLMVALFFARVYQYLNEQLTGTMIIGSFALIYALYLFQMKREYRWRYSSLTATFVFANSFVIYFSLVGGELMLLLTSGIIALTIFVDRQLRHLDTTMLSWLVLSVLQIFAVSVVSQPYVDLFTGMVFGLAVLSYAVTDESLSRYYLPIIILVSGMVIKAFISIDVGSAENILWFYAAFSLLVVSYTLFVQRVENILQRIIHQSVYAIIWLIMSVYIHTLGFVVDEVNIAAGVVLIAQISTVLLIATVYIMKLNEWIDSVAAFSLAITGLLESGILFFLDSVFNVYMLYALIIFAMVLPFVYKAGTILMSGWFISVLFNILLLGSFGEPHISIAISVSYLLFGGFGIAIALHKIVPPYTKIGVLSVLYIVYALVLKIPSEYVNSKLFIWIGIVILSHLAQKYRGRVDTALPEEQVLLTVITAMSTLLWTGGVNYYLVFVLLLLSTISIFWNYKLLFTHVQQKFILTISFETLSFTTAATALLLSTIAVMTNLQLVEISVLLQILLWIVIGVFTVFFLLRKYRTESNVFIESVILLTFIGTVFLTLVVYYASLISNIIFAALIVLFSAIALLNKNKQILKMATAILVIDGIKSLLDLFILTGSDKSYSFILLGVLIVWFTVLYSGPLDDEE